MFPSSAVQISRLCAITWGFHGDSDMSAWHYHLGPWWQLVPAAAKDCQCSWSYHSQDPYCHQIYKDICIHKDILPLALYGSERWAAAKTTSILMSFSSTGVLAVFLCLSCFGGWYVTLVLLQSGSSLISMAHFTTKGCTDDQDRHRQLRPCWWLRVRMLPEPWGSMWPAMLPGCGSIVMCGISCGQGTCLILHHYYSHGL